MSIQSNPGSSCAGRRVCAFRRRVVRDGAGAVVLLTSEANLELLRDSVRAVGGMQLRRWRIVPLGYTRAAVCVIDAVSADAPPAPQPVEVARFDWEGKSGRAERVSYHMEVRTLLC